MNSDIKANGRWHVIFWTCLLLVLILSLMPTVPDMPTTGWDKTNHLLAFAILSILGGKAYPGRSAAVFLGLIVYGGLIEIAQSFTPYRFAEWADLMADGLGLMAGLMLDSLFRKSGRAY